MEDILSIISIWFLISIIYSWAKEGWVSEHKGVVMWCLFVSLIWWIAIAIQVWSDVIPKLRNNKEIGKERRKRILRQYWDYLIHPEHYKDRSLQFSKKRKFKMIFTNYADWLQWEGIQERLGSPPGPITRLIGILIALPFHLLLSEIIEIIKIKRL